MRAMARDLSAATVATLNESIHRLEPSPEAPAEGA